MPWPIIKLRRTPKKVRVPFEEPTGSQDEQTQILENLTSFFVQELGGMTVFMFDPFFENGKESLTKTEFISCFGNRIKQAFIEILKKQRRALEKSKGDILDNFVLESLEQESLKEIQRDAVDLPDSLSVANKNFKRAIVNEIEGFTSMLNPKARNEIRKFISSNVDRSDFLDGTMLIGDSFSFMDSILIDDNERKILGKLFYLLTDDSKKVVTLSSIRIFSYGDRAQEVMEKHSKLLAIPFRLYDLYDDNEHFGDWFKGFLERKKTRAW